MFNPPVWPVMDHSDLQLILEADPRALRGPMSRRFAKAFSDFTQVPYVIPVANGTVSLEHEDALYEGSVEKVQEGLLEGKLIASKRAVVQ